MSVTHSQYGTLPYEVIMTQFMVYIVRKKNCEFTFNYVYIKHFPP